MISMPEIGFTGRERKFIEEMNEREVASPHGWLNQLELDELAQNFDMEVVGRGAECVVLAPMEEQPKSPRVKAILTYEHFTPPLAKALFYSHRILSTLFPHNFPRFYAAFSGEEEKLSGSVRHRISSTPLTDHVGSGNASLKRLEWRTIGRLKSAALGKTISRYPFSKALKDCKRLGIDIRYDNSAVNFILGDDGGEYYVDSVINNITKLSQAHNLVDAKDNIIAYMQKYKFSEEEVHLVNTSLDRLSTTLTDSEEAS